jgi:hypothetical protein
MPNRWIIALVCAGLLLAACTTSGTNVPATQVNPALEDALPPDVALTIRNQISELLGVSIDSLQIEKLEKMDWPDSCLGLPEAEEACTEVITPGWLLTFIIDGQEHRFRANETGTVIRQEP